MRLHTLFFAATVACAGCKQKPASQTEPANNEPEATQQAIAESKPSARDAAEKYVVIIHTSTVSGETATPEVEKVRDATIPRLNTTEFAGLMPCYEIIVAGAFKEKAEALALRKKLKADGIKSYVKNAGRYVGAQPNVESYCKSKLTSQAGDTSWLRFVEDNDGRIFMETKLASVLENRIIENAAKPKPMGDNLAVWETPLPAKKVGDMQRGQKFEVYDVVAGRSGGTCRIKRFSILTRGVPHFGYFQYEAMEELPPTKPGCGSPKLFAEMECEGEGGDLALPTDTGAPTLFTEGGGNFSEDAVRDFLKANPAYRQLRKAAESEAKDVGESLQEELDFRSLSGGGREVLLVSGRFQTGEGNAFCGGEDVRVDFAAVLGMKDGKPDRVLVEPWDLDFGKVEAVLDVESDGILEVLVADQLGTSRTLLDQKGSYRAGISREFCDCGC